MMLKTIQSQNDSTCPVSSGGDKGKNCLGFEI